jgi:ATP-dependent HslUV protease ATP-binding subunit HslU
VSNAVKIENISNAEMVQEIEPGLTPIEIVRELDRYVIAQEGAKRAVAIALRNRWRRLRVPEGLRNEIMPKNIIMIGPTGVGKTEISRRLAKLARAPFVKVEASKFTEVGYVGRDVESIVRDLMEASFSMVKEEERKRVTEKAARIVEERILDILLPGSSESVLSNTAQPNVAEAGQENIIAQDADGVGYVQPAADTLGQRKTREKLRELLRNNKLEDRIIEVETTKHVHAQMQILGPQGMGEIEGQIKDMFANMVPKQKELKKLPVKEARKIIQHEAEDSLIENEKVIQLARKRAEETGIVFIDEIDKICASSSGGGKGPDVSREGVQRDLLPLVEGCTVSTKYGPINTDHILFIASGAFHISKPSDLMPEFQGRFPIRVELRSLMPEDFVRILTEPENALTVQYKELLKTEGVNLDFDESAIKEIARLTAEVNAETENIGARRLHTLLEKLLEDLLFSAHEHSGKTIEINKQYVAEKLGQIVADTDLSRFIL